MNLIKNSSNPWIVLKFGGSSVCKLQHWQTIARLTQQYRREGFKICLVCSAIRGVTDALEKFFTLHSRTDCEKLAYEQAMGWIQTIHQDLATTLEVEIEMYIGNELRTLRQFVHDVQKTHGQQGSELTSPRMQATIMALGELMSTKLGAAWLSKQGLPVVWQDARSLLVCNEDFAGLWDHRYLTATCTDHPDPHLQAKLQQQNAEVVITQGFIASDSQGNTTLLGRGGSDTSAAYFAARLQAKKLEIWTDVAGMFTLDPRCYPEANLLTHLSYQEAEQMAKMGAKVLHPRCIAPVRNHGIPLSIRCTESPELLGTSIGLQHVAAM